MRGGGISPIHRIHQLYIWDMQRCLHCHNSPRILLCSLEMFLDLLTTISNNANISQSYFKMQLKLFPQSLEVLSSIIKRPWQSSQWKMVHQSDKQREEWLDANPQLLLQSPLLLSSPWGLNWQVLSQQKTSHVFAELPYLDFYPNPKHAPYQIPSFNNNAILRPDNLLYCSCKPHILARHHHHLQKVSIPQGWGPLKNAAKTWLHPLNHASCRVQ